MNLNINKVLDSIKQKQFYLFDYMTGFETFKEELTSKEKFYSSLMGIKIRDKNYQHLLKTWDRF